MHVGVHEAQPEMMTLMESLIVSTIVRMYPIVVKWIVMATNRGMLARGGALK